MTMLFNFNKKAAPVSEAPKKGAVPVKGGKAAPPAPAAKGKITKAAPAPVPVASSFAAGLVGSDVEAPEFDPLQLSAGRSEETLAWYRAAELKVA